MTSVKCGWPQNTWPDEPTVCPCGFIFPDKVAAEFPHWHGEDAASDDWLDGGDVEEEDLDFG